MKSYKPSAKGYRWWQSKFSNYNFPFSHDLELCSSKTWWSISIRSSPLAIFFFISSHASWYINSVRCFCPQLEQQLAYSEFQRRVHNIVDKIDKWDIRDRDLLRQLRNLAAVGPSVLPPDQLNRVCKINNTTINSCYKILRSLTREPRKDVNSFLYNSPVVFELFPNTMSKLFSWLIWYRKESWKFSNGWTMIFMAFMYRKESKKENWKFFTAKHDVES